MVLLEEYQKWTIDRTRSRLLTRFFVAFAVVVVWMFNVNVGMNRSDFVQHYEARAVKIISTPRADIWHFPSRREVCVKMDETCPYPDLFGRISGSSLALLDEWENHNRIIQHEHGSEADEFYCGSYKNAWLPPAEYNLEIIVVLCKSFGWNSPLRNDNFTLWLDYDFKNICLEYPKSNSITLDSSTLTVVQERSISSQNEEQQLLNGRWRMLKNTPNASYGALSTRYQPQDCRGDPLPARCTGPMDNSYVDRLNFRWRNDTKISDFLKQYRNNSRVDNDLSKRSEMKTLSSKICIVGASHTRVLFKSLQDIRLSHHFIRAERMEFPHELSTKFFAKYYYGYNCTKFLIGVGQYPAGWPGGFPYSFKRWRDEMTQVATNEKVFKIDDEIKLILRSLHHNPIGDKICACPPTDWRSPTVIDGYNSILRDIVSSVNNSRVSYLDTSFITKPVWDSAPDWCHLHRKVSNVEALYIAYKLLGGR